MLDRPRFTDANHKAISSHNDPLGMEQRRLFSDEMSRQQEMGITRWYREGGDWFVEWAKTHYRRWNGKALDWDEPYQEEAYQLRGNPWVECLIEEKGGQIGMSEAFIALAAFLLADVRISVGYGFEQERKMRDLTGPRIQPAFSHIQPIQALQKRYKAFIKREDADSKDRKMSVGGTPLTFFFCNFASKGTQERQVPPSMSSFEAWAIFCDEVEAWGAGMLDIARQRQSACTMPTKPLRAGSTPGAEGGVVDGQVRSSLHLFQWQTICPHCQTAQFLHPFGNLLRPVLVRQDDGSEEEEFLDITGKPLNWFAHSSDRLLDQIHSAEEREQKINTAYVGCVECGMALGWEAIAGGHFADNLYREQRAVTVSPDTNGITLREFCAQLLREQRPVLDWVALRLPRLASKLFKPSERIRALVNSKNPADTIQQGLGVAVSVGMGKLSLPRLLKCVGQALPEWCKEPDFIVMGIDQAPAAHWFTLEAWYFPPDEKDLEAQWIGAHVRILEYGTLAGFEEVEERITTNNIDLIGCDMEPEQQQVANFARKHSPRKVKKGRCYPFDQVTLRGGQPWRESIRLIQKQKVRLYSLDRTWGLDAVRNRVNRGLLYLPKGLAYDPKDPGNLLYHFLTSERQFGKWTEADGEPDHLMHAHNFAEAAVHTNLFTKKGGGMSFAVMGEPGAKPMEEQSLKY